MKIDNFSRMWTHWLDRYVSMMLQYVPVEQLGYFSLNGKWTFHNSQLWSWGLVCFALKGRNLSLIPFLSMIFLQRSVKAKKVVCILVFCNILFPSFIFCEKKEKKNHLVMFFVLCYFFGFTVKLRQWMLMLSYQFEPKTSPEHLTAGVWTLGF